ncbi:uncharacterized protein LOC135350299 isoform X3 [Halichondria panicea]|uniref:uncharacterized protein LOC135350299 isoform X3 n=1 Tax=Halichondria panicea TaxID=6063 RepID=UPI00312B845B
MVEHRLPKQSMANIDVNLGAQSSYGSQTLPRQAVIETSTRYLGYRKLVGDISDRLRKENALRLAYMYDLPAWYYEVGTTYDTAFSLRVLIALEGKGVFSPESLDGLMKALKDISREDCAKLVDEYLGSCELQSSLECTSVQESDLRRSKSSSENSRRWQARGNHYNSMNIPVDVIERDLTQPTLHQSHSIPSEIGVHECATTIGIRTSSMPPVHRSVSHQDFRLSIECIISNVESLVKQISTVSHETQRSITAQSTPNSSVNLPTCLRDALASAKLVTSNLKLALASKNLGKPSSLPVTPGRVSPVIPSFNISDERNFSRSGSAGLVPLETNHELEQVNKKLFFEGILPSKNRRDEKNNLSGLMNLVWVLI